MKLSDSPKILLVDDLKINLMILDDVLSSLNVERVLAYSGEEAIAQVRNHEFALIISDVQMPNMTGFEMIEQIRKIKGREDTSVIFLSASYKNETDIIKGIQSGAVDFITKPFNRSILIGKVELFIRLYEQNKNLKDLVLKLNEKNKELIRNRLFVEKITDAVIDAIFMTDNDFKIVFWNRAAEDIFGYSDKDILLSDIHELIMQDDSTLNNVKKLFSPTTNVQNETTGTTIECKFKRKDNNIIPVELTFAPIIIDDLSYIVSVARNISVRKEIERKLKEANKAKSEFIANMSHEFRTPMNVVIGISKALINYDSSNLDDEQIEGLKHILQSGTRLLDLVNDLLDLSKVESGKMTVSLKTFSLDNLLSDLKGLVEELIKEKNLNFSIMKDKSVPDFLISDQRKLYQILVNLISNAVKFTEKGNIRLFVYQKETNIHFEVSDTGIGISEENLESVFEKFTQIDSSAQKKYKGTGLGLALCKEFVNMLNGNIVIESSPGKGSIVKFYIPVQNIEIENTCFTDHGIYEEDNHIVDQKLLLLIEDDKELQYYYKNYLSKYGIILDCADDGKTGLDKIRALQPDIIILDLKLKSVSGYDILRIMKFEKDMRDIPVIIISDLDEPPSFALYNYELYINKPVDEQVLLKHIKNVLSNIKDKSIKPLIISESIQELEHIKRAFNALNVTVSTLTSIRKIQFVINKLKPDFIFLDYNNTSKNTQEITATIQNFNNTDEINIVLYTDEVEDPGLLSIIDQSHHIKTIIKTPDLKNNLSKLINEFSSIKTPA